MQREQGKLYLLQFPHQIKGIFFSFTSYHPKTETINIKCPIKLKGQNHHHPQETLEHPLKSLLGPNPTDEVGVDPEKLPLLPLLLHQQKHVSKLSI